jgi:hypothetical protein
MSPHEIALAAAGLAPSLGLLPPKQRHVLHLAQGHTSALGAAVAPPSSWLARWPADDGFETEVTLIACLQDGCAGAAPAGPPYGRGRCHMIWAAPASALLEAVREAAGNELADLLLDPVYTTAAAAMPRGNIDHCHAAVRKTPCLSHCYKNRSIYQDRLRANIGNVEKRVLRFLQGQQQAPEEKGERSLSPVFGVSERSGRVRSLLGVGLGAVSPMASPQHVEALDVLHSIVADPLTWTVLDLQVCAHENTFL